ncbi:unnamed protein product [Auanema sp. JU1783]|nr:unnamed protein product [Auanema sp. JU1783]
MVKQLYLSGGIDLKSHASMRHLSDFAIDVCEPSFMKRQFLKYHCWKSAEKLHQDVYGSGNFEIDQYADLIKNIEKYVHEFSKINRPLLFMKFKESFIDVKSSHVVVKKTCGTVKLGGVVLKNEYDVFTDEKKNLILDV